MAISNNEAKISRGRQVQGKRLATGVVLISQPGPTAARGLNIAIMQHAGCKGICQTIMCAATEPKEEANALRQGCRHPKNNTEGLERQSASCSSETAIMLMAKEAPNPLQSPAIVCCACSNGQNMTSGVAPRCSLP